eukprot:2086103-Rhodomonas_salina.1
MLGPGTGRALPCPKDCTGRTRSVTTSLSVIEFSVVPPVKAPVLGPREATQLVANFTTYRVETQFQEDSSNYNQRNSLKTLTVKKQGDQQDTFQALLQKLSADIQDAMTLVLVTTRTRSGRRTIFYCHPQTETFERHCKCSPRRGDP